MVEELKALFGMNILIGLNPLSLYKLSWYQNDSIGNIGVKKMTCSIYMYLIGPMSQLEIVLIMTNYKIHPVLNTVQDSFANSYKPGKIKQLMKV